MSSSFTRPRVIVPGLLAIVVVILGTILLTSGGGPSGQQVDIAFDSVNGLIKGAPVRAGNVNVGVVEEVDLGAGDVPHAKIVLDEDYVMHEGATASLRMLSQAGQLNRYIDVTSGHGQPLPDGAQLSLNSTDQPVELDDAFSTFDPKTRANIQRLVASLDRGLEGHGTHLAESLEHSDKALRETAALVADVAADAPALRRLVRESSTVVGELSEDPEGLQGVADQLAGTLSVTARRQQELGQTVDGLGPGLRGARRSLDELNSAMPALRSLAKAAGPASRQARLSAPDIRRLLAAAPETLTKAQDLTQTAPAQLEALQPLLKESKPVIQRLPNALKQFAPILDQMRARAPDALGWLPLLGDALGNFDVNGHAARFMFIAEPAPENEADPATNGPGLLARPFDRVPGAANGEPWRDFRKSFVGDKPWKPKTVTEAKKP
ncbi:MAG: MCE family protein [Solirubrobacteraceae bacterium]|nr:MCE family protein [Solirubrobacteraceae bacterium]